MKYSLPVSPLPEGVTDHVRKERPGWGRFYVHRMDDGRLLADRESKGSKVSKQALDVTSLFPPEPTIEVP